MSSSIDPSKPTSGDALTQDVRDNFQHAKDEIEALQTAVASASSPLTKGARLTLTGNLYNADATQAHGLSGIPSFFLATFECTTADGEYTAGDVIPAGQWMGIPGGQPWFGISADATNFKVVLPYVSPYAIKKSTHAQFAMTSGSWSLHIDPYLVN